MSLPAGLDVVSPFTGHSLDSSKCHSPKLTLVATSPESLADTSGTARPAPSPEGLGGSATTASWSGLGRTDIGTMAGSVRWAPGPPGLHRWMGAGFVVDVGALAVAVEDHDELSGFVDSS
jgi:hypothetical protein